MKKIFFICLLWIGHLSTITSQNINYLEYFWDEDPGLEQATSLDITSGINIDEALQINTSGLDEGVHVLNIRIRDNQNRWSFLQQTPIYFLKGFNSQEITQLEYFFDENPGLGNGISVQTASSTEIDHLLQIDLSSLTPGVHTLFVRAKNKAEQWSFLESKVIFIGTNLSNRSIVGLEYYWDTDPGLNNASYNDIDLFPEEGNYFLDIDIPHNLSIEEHNLCIRMKDGIGVWSETECQAIDIADIVSSIEELNSTKGLQIKAYPNPFSNTMTLQYVLPSTTDVKIEIIDLSGKVYKEFSSRKQLKGKQELEMDLSALSSGVYLCKIKTNKLTQVHRLSIIK